MSWTNPTQPPTGTLITSSIYNTDLVDNLIYLKSVLSKSVCNGRLTLETGVPVSTTDQTAKTTLYFTPFHGNQLALYDGAWTPYSFSELSLSLSGYTLNFNYDIWGYLSSGTPALESLIWSTNTARATALALDNGIYIKSGDATRRYLGTIRITSTTGQCEDSLGLRYVWNTHNRVMRRLYCKDTTDSWTYSTASWRQANGVATAGVSEVRVVMGLSENAVELFNYATVVGSVAASNQIQVGIGIDSTSVNSAQVFGGLIGTIGGAVSARYIGHPGIGVHQLQRLEYANIAGTATWYGDNGAVSQSGMVGYMMG